jgi:hypothetical protein
VPSKERIKSTVGLNDVALGQELGTLQGDGIVEETLRVFMR